MIRFFDILFSSVAIIVFTPFMIPIMIALKLTGEHDIFYKQKRIGKNEKEFNLLKFATMLRNSPNMKGGLITLENDPRILPLGKFLRKTKINELPQLLNILVGDMSIVGARPQAKPHYALYSSVVKTAISQFPPGLSGIGSIIFHNEEDILHSIKDSEHFHDTVIAPYKGTLEVWYIEHRTLLNYFKCILWTVLVIVFPNKCNIYKVFKNLPPIPEELTPYIS